MSLRDYFPSWRTDRDTVSEQARQIEALTKDIARTSVLSSAAERVLDLVKRARTDRDAWEKLANFHKARADAYEAAASARGRHARQVQLAQRRARLDATTEVLRG